MKTVQSVVLIVVVHLLAPYSAVRCDWDIEILDTEGFGEGASSLLIDQHDRVFVAYAPRWNYRILHKDGGPWLEIPAPDSIRSQREHVDMDVASDGRIHVVFDAYAANELNSRVWHDEWDGGSWVITPVAEGWEPSLPLASDSIPMVGFALPGGLAFGSRSDTSWQVEPVDSLTGWESSIASDSRSNPHIGYYAFRSGQPPILKYATRDSSGWHAEVVDDGGDRGHMSALALDSNETPHIAYIACFPEIDPDSLEVWYAYRAGRGWRIEVVDRWDGLEPPGGFWDGQIALALDSDDVPHIAYRNKDQLYYAKRDPSTRDWSREVVDPTPGTGRYASLALDSSGSPHISYSVRSGGIRYATRQPTTGIREGESDSIPLHGAVSLSQNYPNPFNPSTTIEYEVPTGGPFRISVAVYHIRGRRVRTLMEGRRLPGGYSVHWDGRDNEGEQMASGVYLYRIHAGSFTSTRKMILMR